MPVYTHRRGKGFREIRVLDPNEVARRRQEFELIQIVDRPIVLASRHNFSPALSFGLHQPHDLILQAAKAVLGAFSYKTFAGYCNPLYIEPLFSTDAVFMHQAIEQGVPVMAMYAVGRYGLMAKVPLWLNPINSHVLVQEQQKFVDLYEWLKTLTPTICSAKGQAGYDLLRQWYVETGQPFQLMQLPSELRIQILEHAVGFDIYPNGSTTIGWGSMISTQRATGYGGTLKKVDPPNTDVMTLNKKIYSEMSGFLQARTCKCFQMDTYLMNYLRLVTIQQPPLAQHVQILELDLTHKEYFSLFGVQVAPFHILQGRLHGEVNTLINLQLKHLFLRFRAPLAKTDPWGGLGPLNGHSEGDDWRGNRDGRWHISCNKVLVDWILTYAKDYLTQLSKAKVSLSGYIKNSTKAKWDKILADEKAGIERGMEVERNIIDHWPTDNLGPKCHCTNTCGSRTWWDKPVSRRRTMRMLHPLKFDYED